MNKTPETSEFKCALVEFKDLVATLPEVGNVEDWSDRLRPAFERLDTLVQSRKSRIHAKLFSEIANQEPNHDNQINQFKKTDEEIEIILGIVRSHLIVIGLPKSELDEVKIPDQILDLSEHANALIRGIEEHEKSVAEWFVENFEP